jgi:hypothetical protein
MLSASQMDQYNSLITFDTNNIRPIIYVVAVKQRNQETNTYIISEIFL